MDSTRSLRGNNVIVICNYQVASPPKKRKKKKVIEDWGCHHVKFVDTTILNCRMGGEKHSEVGVKEK